MATKIRTSKSATSPATTFESKTEYAKDLFRKGKSVSEVSKTVPGMGYAFAYGIAKKGGWAATAAKRRQTRAVQTVGDEIEIRTDAGIVVRVNRVTGAVRKSKK